MALASEVSIIVFEPRVIPWLEVPIVTAAPPVILDASVTVLGAVAVNPPVNVNASVAASPNTNVPVFPKVTAFVKEFVDPVKLTLYACAVPVTVRLGVETLPWNAIVADEELSLRTILVPVVTELANVVPPELVTVKLESDVDPTAPVTAIVPPVPAFNVRACELALDPLMELLKLILAPAVLTPALVESSVIEFPSVTAPV